MAQRQPVSDLPEERERLIVVEGENAPSGESAQGGSLLALFMGIVAILAVFTMIAIWYLGGGGQ